MALIAVPAIYEISPLHLAVSAVNDEHPQRLVENDCWRWVMVKIGCGRKLSPPPRSRATARRLFGIVLCTAFGASTAEDQGPGVASPPLNRFPSRTLGCVAAIGDSMTQAFNANARCRFTDQPSLSWATNQTTFCGLSDKTYSLSERASCVIGPQSRSSPRGALPSAGRG